MDKSMIGADRNRPKGNISNLGDVKIVKTTKDKVGQCNFHLNTDYSDYYVVYEITGIGTSVRICNKCLNKIIKDKRYL